MLLMACLPHRAGRFLARLPTFVRSWRLHLNRCQGSGAPRWHLPSAIQLVCLNQSAFAAIPRWFWGAALSFAISNAYLGAATKPADVREVAYSQLLQLAGLMAGGAPHFTFHDLLLFSDPSVRSDSSCCSWRGLRRVGHLTCTCFVFTSVLFHPSCCSWRASWQVGL